MLEFLHMFDAAVRPTSGTRLTPPGTQLDGRGASTARRVTNPSTPAVSLPVDKGDSTARQQAVRPNTTGAREKCQGEPTIVRASPEVSWTFW